MFWFGSILRYSFVTLFFLLLLSIVYARKHCEKKKKKWVTWTVSGGWDEKINKRYKEAAMLRHVLCFASEFAYGFCFGPFSLLPFHFPLLKVSTHLLPLTAFDFALTAFDFVQTNTNVRTCKAIYIISLLLQYILMITLYKLTVFHQFS